MKRFQGRLPGRRPGGDDDAVVEGRNGDDGAPETVTARYRRRPGAWLLGAALLIPLLLALVGLYLDGSARRSDPPASGQAAASAPAPAPVGDPITVTTADGRRTVTARVRDDQAKRILLDGVRASTDDTVIDQITVSGDADGPSVVGVGSVLAAGRTIENLGLTVDRATLTLTGTAPDQASGTSTVFAAGQSYPGARLVDRLHLPGGGPQATGPLTPECEQLRTDIAAQLKSAPIKFAFAGAKVDDSSVKQLTDIGGKLAQCPFSRIEVAGHTDSEGSAAANAKVSQRRADAVRAVLIQAGVPSGAVTAKGYGATKPVADNSTAEGRAANRRVEINAS